MSADSTSSGRLTAGAPFHSTALAVWLIAAMLPSLLTSNPVHLAFAFGLVLWNHRQVAGRSPDARAWGSFAGFALFFVVFTLIFNVLMGGAGTTVLMELPAYKIFDDDGSVLFQIGGDVTLESLVFALIRALALLSVIYALATFNTLVDHYQLLRALPRQLSQAATVVSIAVTFMPQLVEAQKDVRQALALRGRPVRALRDAVPMILILLSEALERAMGLAESMEARGYSGPPDPAGGRPARWAVTLGLLSIGVGTIAGDLGLELFGTPWDGPGQRTLLVGLGTAAILGAWNHLGRRRAVRTRYRREPWRRRDAVLVALSAAAGTVLISLFLLDREAFFFPVFPTLKRPSADFRLLLPMLALLGPSLLLPEPTRAAASPEPRP